MRVIPRCLLRLLVAHYGVPRCQGLVQGWAGPPGGETMDEPGLKHYGAAPFKAAGVFLSPMYTPCNNKYICSSTRAAKATSTSPCLLVFTRILAAYMIYLAESFACSHVSYCQSTIQGNCKGRCVSHCITLYISQRFGYEESVVVRRLEL